MTTTYSEKSNHVTMIKIIGLGIAICISTHFAFSQTAVHNFVHIDHEHALGKCTGSPNCTACRDCSRCAHCNAGGSCGVCDREIPQKNVHQIEKKKETLRKQQPNDKTTSGNQAYQLKKVEITVEMASLRKGPATDFPLVTNIYRNQKLICLFCVGNWAKVKTTTGQIGFVRSETIKISSKQ